MREKGERSTLLCSVFHIKEGTYSRVGERERDADYISTRVHSGVVAAFGGRRPKWLAQIIVNL